MNSLFPLHFDKGHKAFCLLSACDLKNQVEVVALSLLRRREGLTSYTFDAGALNLFSLSEIVGGRDG